VPFVGAAKRHDAPVRVAAAMREKLGLSVRERQQLPTWTDALRQLVEKAEEAGVFVMASSVVGNNPNRKLDVADFRGFALVDDKIPGSQGDFKAKCNNAEALPACRCTR